VPILVFYYSVAFRVLRFYAILSKRKTQLQRVGARVKGLRKPENKISAVSRNLVGK